MPSRIRRPDRPRGGEPCGVFREVDEVAEKAVTTRERRQRPPVVVGPDEIDERAPRLVGAAGSDLRDEFEEKAVARSHYRSCG